MKARGAVTRYRGGQPLAWRLEFKPQDAWIGVFWKKKARYTEIWICLVPMLPLNIIWQPKAKV